LGLIIAEEVRGAIMASGYDIFIPELGY